MRPGGKNETPEVRLESSFQSKGFDAALDKVIPLYADITQESFGLKATELYDTMKTEVTHIIHCAWAVNFAIPLPAFEPQLLGLHHLLAFCIQSARNPRLLFCSSVGVVQAIKGPATIASAPITSFDNCSSLGYSQSKLVGEHVVEGAAKNGANAAVLRIGQIIPGRRRGSRLWNPSEALPLLIRSASKDSVGALPVLDTGRDGCDWIEADTLADTILQLAGIGHVANLSQRVYNLVNPRMLSWKGDLLPALQRAGLEFETVPWQVWLERLESSTEDAIANPSRKLLGFWLKQTQRDGQVTFDTTAAEADSLALRGAVRAVDGDFVEQLVEAWRQHDTASKAQ